MKKRLVRSLGVALITLGVILGFSVTTVFAEDNEEEAKVDTNAISVSITPVSNIVSLSPGSVYDYSFKVTNGGASVMNFEVYAAPYSYVYSESEDAYKLGFNNETGYTQIARWITIRDQAGNYVESPRFSADPGETVEVFYRISTPSSIPDGGQYAVIFAHALSDSTGGGIKTEASPGLVIYGRSTGETISSAEITELKIEKSINTTATTGEQTTINRINASAKVRNTGNIDFNASGVLKVDGILFGGSYETPSNKGRVSIIPETELAVSDEWDETPAFGIFKVTWTVKAGGETETIESIVMINMVPVIIVFIILLTILIIWIIIRVRKRKERRSRFSV